MESFKLNKSDYKLIGGYFFLATIWLIYKFYLDDYLLSQYFYEIPIIWVQTFSLLIISKWLIDRYFIKKENTIFLMLLMLFSFWSVSFIQMLLCDFGPYQDTKLIWNNLPEMGELIIGNINESVFNVCIPLCLISGKKYYEYQLNQLKFADAQKELELKTLRTQFAPHFLFNNLNTVDALIDQQPEKAKEYISHLANLYRYITENKEEDIVTITKELEFVKSYIYLIQTRFAGEYKFNIEGNQTAEKYVPTGALQALLENVVKHNSTNGDNQIITTHIHLKENYIKISNSKGETGTEKTTKSGIWNLQKRYELLTDEKLIIKESHDFFEVKIPLLQLENHHQ